MKLAEAKARLNIPAVWLHLRLRGKPGKSCRCPWREDRNPSFSVYDGGSRWKDHATGEHGDAIDFYQMATGLPAVEAYRQFVDLAFGRRIVPVRPIGIITRAPKTPAAFPLRMDQGNEDHHRVLAESRHVSVSAVKLAAQRGLLLFGIYRGYSAWFVTDVSRRIVQARRLDGGRWWAHGPKALNSPGTTPSWPAGAASVNEFTRMLCVEGGPDLLAALHFVCLDGVQDRVTAVGILGANNDIQSDALTLFRKKRIRIVPHKDQPGAQAAIRWQNQFLTVAAITDVVSIDMLVSNAGNAKDLNDLCRTPPESQSMIASALIDGL